MIKFWKIKRNNNFDIFLINNASLFKGKIKQEELHHFSKLLESQKIPESLFEIPFSYIKTIKNQKNKKEIKIFFGNDSEEEIICEDFNLKNEIFEYLKNNISVLSYTTEKPSIFKYAKPQIFAIIFTLGLFLWSLYYAVEIENGVEYILEGRAGIGAIIYSIGLLGVVKVVLLFSCLIGIALFSFSRKIKSRSEIEELKRIN